jgi:FtsP/CotA-like multicopper oxidase with cupredoxin domain
MASRDRFDLGRTLSVHVVVVALILTMLGAVAVPTPADATSGGSPYDVPQVVDTNPDPDIVETTFVAEEATVDIGGGVMANAQTFNGTIPGPEFRLVPGQRVIVHLVNDLDEATGIHWHGIELANNMDGTPLTQDQVPPGGTYTYDFIAPRPGVYWYHPHHQFSTGQVFKGMYGSIIIEDPNEAALVADDTLPGPADTHTMVLADMTVCKAPGSNDTETYDPSLPWAGGGALPVQPPPTPDDLCEGSPLDRFGVPLPAGETWQSGDIPYNVSSVGTPRVNEGQVVLTNGRNVGGRSGSPAAPGALSPGAATMAVQPGQGVRLQLVNAATTRFFRLRMTLSDGTQVPLVRVGGEAGLLDAALVEGVVAGFDFIYDAGEILIDPGDREDVVAVFPSSASGVATLWTLDSERTGSSFSNIPTVPVAHFDVTGPAAAPSYTIIDGTPLRSATGDPVEVLPPATNTLIDPASLSPAKPGMASSDMKFTTLGGPSIDGVPGHHSYTGYFAEHAPPASARYAAIGDVLELSVTNETAAHHPYHLHGFSIQPLTMSNCPGAVTGFTFPRTEFMDNVNVPPGCTLTFRVQLEDRFFADQVTPGGGLGRWMFHCHIFFHHQLGMVSELVVTDAAGNERPYIDLATADLTGTEGDTLTASGPFFDPDGDAVTFTASVGTVVDNGDGTWGWSHVAGDGPSSPTVHITITDSQGNSGQVALYLDIANAPPTVDPLPDVTISEGQALDVAATFSDPGIDEPYTATVDFGTGDGPEPATVVMSSTTPPQTGTVSASRTYGDDGTFTVTVVVTDADGASGMETFEVDVSNVDPDATIETVGPVIAGIGDPVALDGRATDPGSDDLTTTWAFGDGSTDDVQVSLVNPPNPDPHPSPTVQPRDVEHDVVHAFGEACAYEVTFSAADDDGGDDVADVVVVVVGESSTILGPGYWLHQYRGNGTVAFSDAELECYLAIAATMSAVFPELTALGSIGDAADVLFAPPSRPIEAQLDRQLLTSWLNFANGAIGLGDLVDTDGDSVPDMTFADVMTTAEAVRLDVNATAAQLEAQKDILDRLNQ